MAEEPDVQLDTDAYDVIVVGTGLSEAILAGALARIGKKVLHLDGNDYYGGPFASFSLQSYKSFLESAQAPQQPKYTEDQTFDLDGRAVVGVSVCGSATSATSLLRSGAEFNATSDAILADVKQGRRYNIDITPRAIWSVNPTIEILVRAGVNRYLEFKCLDHTYVFLDGKIQQVPCTKGDIFKSKTITVQEKRQLMKLITALTKPEDSEKAELEAAANTPFIDFLKSRGLSQNLQTFIMYSIAMIGPDQRAEDAGSSKLTTSVGLEYMLRFLKSLGRYGNTPLIYPLFGMSDINQAFTRFAAVYGAVYVLGHAPTRILVDKSDTSASTAGKVVGTVLGSKQILKSPFVVASMDNVPSFLADEESSFMSRLTCAINKTLDPEAKDVLLFATIPPHASADFDNPDTVYILQLDPSTNCCPTGKFLVHMWTQGSASSTANLRAICNKLFRKDAADNNDSRPEIEWVSVFEQRIRKPAASEKIPHGLVIVPDVEQSIDPDASFQVAKKLFQQMYPGEEFIPEVPHPDDVKWGVEDDPETTSDAAQTEGTTSTQQQSTSESSTGGDDFAAPASFD